MITDVPNPDTAVKVVVADGPGVTVATVVVALLQVPPAVALLNIVVVPGHKVVVPDIGPGGAATVTVTVVVQPVADDVNLITDVPTATPVTAPVAATTVAAVVVALLQVPPPTAASVNAVVEPTHTLVVPVIAGGNA